MYFLDTNICIYFLNGTIPSVRDNLLSTPPNDIKIPVIVHSELWYGVLKSQRVEENKQKLQQFLEPFDVIDYTPHASRAYAELRFATESKGNIVGPNDLIIASIVFANNGTLVTRNTDEFSSVPQLKLTQW